MNKTKWENGVSRGKKKKVFKNRLKRLLNGIKKK